jgi:uncharacterized membrane protein YkvA (DUF1232 family)
MRWKKNPAFTQARQAAPEYARNPQKAGRLIQELYQKARKNRGQLRQIWTEFDILCHLLRDWNQGRYTQLPWRSLLWALTAALYFINPFDLIPDFIPVIGYLDDAAILSFVLRAIRKDVRKYEAWLEQWKNGIKQG